MKKILIIKPKIDNGTPGVTRYIYPKSYNTQHARHICYNYAAAKNLKGGYLAEGMVIYEAGGDEIKALLKEDGICEISHDEADTTGRKWKPEAVIGNIKKKEFNIKDW